MDHFYPSFLVRSIISHRYSNIFFIATNIKCRVQSFCFLKRANSVLSQSLHLVDHDNNKIIFILYLNISSASSNSDLQSIDFLYTVRHYVMQPTICTGIISTGTSNVCRFISRFISISLLTESFIDVTLISQHCNLSKQYQIVHSIKCKTLKCMIV